MMNRLRERLRHFMIGRYGADQLGRFMIWVIFVLLVANMFTRSNTLYMFCVLALAYCYLRMFSRNVSKRYEENQKFLRMRCAAAEWFRRKKFGVEQRRNFHIYKCPGCGQKIRVPRGKGRISIHCPKCNADFIKKS